MKTVACLLLVFVTVTKADPDLFPFLPSNSSVLSPMTDLLKAAGDHLLEMGKHFFVVFKKQFNKSYASEEEEDRRFGIFIQNYKLILEHKSFLLNHTFSFELGLTPFADLTDEEFEEQFCKDLNREDLPNDITEVETYTSSKKPPAEIDWRKLGAVTRIKDQRTCGSCWTYSAAGAMEGAHFIKTGKLQDLSTQELLDCIPKGGCNGGHYVFAYQYSMNKNGIELLEDYPYENKKKTCRADRSKPRGGVIENFYKLKPGNEEELKKVVAFEGPVAVGIDSTGWKLFKSSGVYYNPAVCNRARSSPDHAVLIVGYGTAPDGQDYWLIKNSWGTDWGDEGYIKLARNRDNHCSVASDAVYPVA